MPQNTHSTFPNPADNEESVSFVVMPKDTTILHNVSNVGGTMTEKQAVKPSIVSGLWQKRSTYIWVGGLVLIMLGAVSYLLLWPDVKKEETLTTSKLPKVFLQEHFGASTCNEESRCGDNADPDSDGLINYEEFKEQTLPLKNDTDEDGLADGDEINIYLTNPLNKFTDPRPDAIQNGYTDSSQIKNDFDPLTPNLKMTTARKAKIESSIKQYSLHEPTITTLNTVAPKTVSISITNNKFTPLVIEINVNDTVIWLNKDVANRQLNISPNPNDSTLESLQSGTLATNQTYSYKFTTAGVYTIQLSTDSTGTITVK